MPKAKSGTTRLTLSEKVSVGRDRVTALTGNTNVNVEPSKLTAYTNSVSALSNAQAEVGNAQIILNEKYVNQYNAEKEYDKQTLKMVSEINSLTDDEAKIATTGFPVSETGAPESTSVTSAPVMVSASMGKRSGEIIIQWKAVRLSQGYNVEYNADPMFPVATTKSNPVGRITKTNLNGLTSGSNIWVRVQAIKGNDKGPWSDPSLTMVP